MPRDFSDTIDAIRERVNIVDLVSQYLALKKAGKNYRALCPFHREKTPSFMVSEEKQIFHCFGCGVGGDVFTFLMRYENLTFYNALNELAKRVGLTVPRGYDRGEDQGKRDLLFQINQIAADYLHARLLSEKAGRGAREYLKRRGIRHETIEKYRLGYAPPGWTNMVGHFRTQSVDMKMVQSLGLIVPRKQEGWYDHFRNRVIFPIRDTNGRIVGFGGRAMDDATPKYLNSPESLIYKKSRSIYGIEIASREFRQRDCALIVEGYFDLLILHQNGFTNAVAPLGTALTLEQVRIMKRYTRNFVIIFDPDEAGIKAAFRSLDPFMEEEIHPKMIQLPHGHDPDSFVRQAGPEALERAVDGAIPLVEFFLEHTMKQGDSESVEGKVQIARTIRPVLEKIRDPLERRLYAKSLSEKLGVLEEDLLVEPGKEKRARQRVGLGDDQRRLKTTFPASEEALVEVMLNHCDLIPRIFESGAVDAFESEDLRQIAQVLKRAYERKGEVLMGEIIGAVSKEDLRSRVSFWAFSGKFKEEDLERTVQDCIRTVKLSRLKRDRRLITQRIKELEKTDETRRLEELLRQKQHLIEQERNL